MTIHTVGSIWKGEPMDKKMKRIKCKFENDKWGIYLTPLCSVSWGEPYGKCLWVGWLWWLWCFKIGE